MRKKLKKFYIFDEHTDYIKACRRLGMVPVDNVREPHLGNYPCGEFVVMGKSDENVDNLIERVSTNSFYDGFRFMRNGIEVKRLECDGILYEVLGCNECYSGWEITVMALPEMKFHELVSLLCDTKDAGELRGSLGILLKKYYKEFCSVLTAGETFDRKTSRKIARLISQEIAENSEPVSEMHELLVWCRSNK